ncbi:hypothetical protein [Alterisphingorhabdus coralli]|uniref:Uncharacterized protein n=1 Tax=Alterisphingorhabdus coralli TaxID=3071408 RepID=A0AA97FC34_9SPHN|nr:hypothetical protein [Parasphingorhabdus sp. SCSIO 66989]WOE76315.1 hypothetical protein RB602_06280 [Parasphingorhabdus sp. SCSIO 66989]
MSNIPHDGGGLPSYETDNFSYVELIAGEQPKILTVSGYSADGSVAMPAYTVVGFDGRGDLVPATIDTLAPENSIAPIGITASPILGNNVTQPVGLIRAGNFNIGALTVDGTYSDPATLLAAFEDAPTPTNIVLQQINGAAPQVLGAGTPQI